MGIECEFNESHRECESDESLTHKNQSCRILRLLYKESRMRASRNSSCHAATTVPQSYIRRVTQTSETVTNENQMGHAANENRTSHE